MLWINDRYASLVLHSCWALVLAEMFSMLTEFYTHVYCYILSAVYWVW